MRAAEGTDSLSRLTVLGASEPEAVVYREAAELRTALRRFERRSEQLARAQGLTPRQFALLLLIKGAPDGSERATVTDLS